MGRDEHCDLFWKLWSRISSHPTAFPKRNIVMKNSKNLRTRDFEIKSISEEKSASRMSMSWMVQQRFLKALLLFQESPREPRVPLPAGQVWLGALTSDALATPGRATFLTLKSAGFKPVFSLGFFQVCFHPWKLTWHWTIPTFNSKYIFIHGGFFIVMLLLGGVEFFLQAKQGSFGF